MNTGGPKKTARESNGFLRRSAETGKKRPYIRMVEL